MKRVFAIALLVGSLVAGRCAVAQMEGPLPTQVLVNVDEKSTPPANASALTVQVNDRKEPLTAWEQVAPGNAQVALLIDDGLRESIGSQLGDLRTFVRTLAPGVEVMVGFLQYGRVVPEQEFTTDHARAAETIHLPGGVPGMSASPYLCLSDFVKRWPQAGASSSSVAGMDAAPGRKARFIMVLTDGVDPYNGSTSVMNQDSPYVNAAVIDAQRAGVAIYSIYFGDAGIRGGRADNSGQSYLAQLTQATGGQNYWQGVGNPVALAPYLTEFQHAVAETYVATFIAPAGKDPQRDLVHVKFSAPKVKLHAPDDVRAGNKE